MSRFSAWIFACLVTLGAVAASTALVGAQAAVATGPSTCHAQMWCTVTSSGDTSPLATQFAIGNVKARTRLAITQNDVRHQQVGGEILDGTLSGICAWSQYARDWAPLLETPTSSCLDPVHDTSEFVAAEGHAVWTGCYPRCFGGVPLRFDRRCGQKGRIFCYRSNCEEFANFSPWTPYAHPSDPVRMTHRHPLDIRYLARYGDAWTNTPFYLVRDPTIGHGLANWVFISGAACGVIPGPTGTYHSAPRHQ